jgi:hypothetical protein
MRSYNAHPCPQRDQDKSSLCPSAGKAGTMRSVRVSRDVLDDKETVLRQNQREPDQPPWCWSGAIGACGRSWC